MSNLCSCMDKWGVVCSLSAIVDASAWCESSFSSSCVIQWLESKEDEKVSYLFRKDWDWTLCASVVGYCTSVSVILELPIFCNCLVVSFLRLLFLHFLYHLHFTSGSILHIVSGQWNAGTPISLALLQFTFIDGYCICLHRDIWLVSPIGGPVFSRLLCKRRHNTRPKFFSPESLP